jgi:chemotaxis protein CheD
MAKVIPGTTLSSYFDAQLKRDVVKLKPGEFYATTRPLVIATVLGSCVAACIRDPARGGAGMNHFMLPHHKQGHSGSADASSARYGVFAMESLINEFVRRGSQRRDLEAKVFGGAAVMDALLADVGAQNAEFVRDYLTVEGIRITATDLGGFMPRKVLLFVEDGGVKVKYLGRLRNDTIERREEEYARALEIEVEPPSVELF